PCIDRPTLKSMSTYLGQCNKTDNRKSRNWHLRIASWCDGVGEWLVTSELSPWH
ncbi:hypothetical protein CEXT_322271, partial [Caerostris extrusa]